MMLYWQAQTCRRLARDSGLTFRQVYAVLYRQFYRMCFVCGNRGWCRHREPDVEMALFHEVQP